MQDGYSYMQIYQVLDRHYGPQGWWPARSELEMIIGAVLTQNTAWHNVEKALFYLEDHLNADAIRALTREELMEKIRPSGFYTQKSERILALLDWLKQNGDDFETLRAREGNSVRKELLSIKGIGPETADCIMVYALMKPYFIIDAYTRRIMERIGFECPKSYEAFQSTIEMALPCDIKVYNAFHALIVAHAKAHCKVKPICRDCPLLMGCHYGKAFSGV